MLVKYLVFDSGSSASRLMFSDVKKMPNAIETSQVFKIEHFFLKALNKIHMSEKINRCYPLPFRQLWDGFYIVEEAKENPDINYVVVMTNISVKKFRIGYLKSLEKVKNIFLVLVVVDSFIDKKLSPLRIMEKVNFNLIYSFDEKDCKKHELKYTQSLYSKRDDLIPSTNKVNLFFVGRAKDRLIILQNIVEKANKEKCLCNFLILNAKRKSREKVAGITYIDKVVPYDEVLPMILASDCLLDIVQEGQAGFTMRVYEAIFYNKKLITNNKSIKKISYYNPAYMQVIDDIKDIDFDFIMKKEHVDYGYKGEYSPIHLLEEIVNNEFGWRSEDEY